MSALLAGLSGGCAVFALWELAAGLLRVRTLAAIGRALGPARAAGRSGRAPSDVERRRMALVATCVAAATGALLAGPRTAILLAVAAPAAAALVIHGRRRRWRRRLEAGAPAALHALADAMAGGHGLDGALTIATSDGALSPPARHVLRSAASAVALGAPVAQALDGVRDAAGPGTWDAAVAAMLLQREAGGDLVALLRGVAAGGEAATRDVADARVASSQARLTARIVLGLPALAAAGLLVAAPRAAAAMLSRPLPVALLTGAGILQIMALLAVRRIARAAR